VGLCVLRRIFRPFSFTHHRTVVYFIGFLLIYSAACCRLYVQRCTHCTPILLVSRAAGSHWQAENKNTLKTMEYSKIDDGLL